MLIYGVSEIFALKKTIKQFLQPMIEQVWGGGGCAARMCRYFKVSFQSYYIFVPVFFQFTDAFLGRFYQYLHIFCCILFVFHQKVKQLFGHKIFVWFLYSWAYFLITTSIFLGAIFDTGSFTFCSTVLNLSCTLPPFFYGELPSLPGSMHYRTSKMVM